MERRVPSPRLAVIDQLYSNSTDAERMSATLKNYVSTYPLAWDIMANTFYLFEEDSALAAMKKYLPEVEKGKQEYAHVYWISVATVPSFMFSAEDWQIPLSVH